MVQKSIIPLLHANGVETMKKLTVVGVKLNGYIDGLSVGSPVLGKWLRFLEGSDVGGDVGLEVGRHDGLAVGTLVGSINT